MAGKPRSRPSSRPRGESPASGGSTRAVSSTTEVRTLRLVMAREWAYVVQVLDRSEVRPRRRTWTRAGTRSGSSNREAVGPHAPKARPREHDAPHVPHATRWLRHVARPAHQGGTRGAIRSPAALAVAAA